MNSPAPVLRWFTNMCTARRCWRRKSTNGPTSRLSSAPMSRCCSESTSSSNAPRASSTACSKRPCFEPKW
ncbi:hypothetical protein ACFPRL_10825 [Pseudoclavibacter helvolus]